MKKVTFDEMIMISALYKTNKLSSIFRVQTHWNKSLRVDMSPHSDILFYWFRPNQSLHLLLYDTCLEEKQQIGPINIWFDPNGARTHNLLHLRRECEPLHHWCGLYICDGQYFLYMYIYSNMMFKHIYIYTSHTWCYIIHLVINTQIVFN